ncbi:MAG: hypothetical protein ACNA71_04530 [Kiritimatiellia bacterium]
MKEIITCLLVMFSMPLVLRANPQLTRLQIVYERDVAVVEEEFRAARLALPQRYMQILQSMEVHYTREQDKPLAEKIRTVRLQFVLDPTPSGLVVASEPPILARLRQNYVQEFAASARHRQERLQALEVQYRASLTQLRTELTRRGDTDSAQRVSSVLAALRPGGAVAADAVAPDVEIDLGLDSGMDGGVSTGPVTQPAASSPWEQEDADRDDGDDGERSFDDLLSEWM